ncbi:MAG: hypothetical protein KGH64_02125 [Candidatus Micrarchaeota archaeon]|nr:hypothetical protein [Candidatus Micrarchaeota archaeon]MDE1859029.1 hypothetical protein [Candidatus Micrarchaeota archaeon]
MAHRQQTRSRERELLGLETRFPHYDDAIDSEIRGNRAPGVSEERVGVILETALQDAHRAVSLSEELGRSPETVENFRRLEERYRSGYESSYRVLEMLEGGQLLITPKEHAARQRRSWLERKREARRLATTIKLTERAKKAVRDGDEDKARQATTAAIEMIGPKEGLVQVVRGLIRDFEEHFGPL